jgi:putative glutamine amidotransferase
MTSAPIIGITTYGPNAKRMARAAGIAHDREDQFRLPTEYIAAIRRAGGVPWMLAPGEPRLEDFLAAIDALILPGGGDMDPALYGGRLHAQMYGVDRGRDETELALARAAVEREIPTLGICRGLQVLNVALGGTLVEHLPDEIGRHLAHRGGTSGTYVQHDVEVGAGSRLAQIVGGVRLDAASSHHQAVRALGRDLVVAGTAADGTVEAVELPRHKYLVGVQWHPEHTAARDPQQQRLFDALVQSAL